MMPSKELWSMPSGTAGGNSSSRAVMASSNGYGFMSTGMHMRGGVPGSSGMAPVVSMHDRSQEICKYFVNGGCLRGAACPYLHELPDERHLDVNGLGFILNPNVQNAQKTVSVPQSSVAGAASTAGQVSPTSTGSPLVLGLGGQAGVGRQFPFSGNSNSATAKSGGAKPHFVPVSTPPVMMQPSLAKQPPKYRPPEPYLEHNLPPVLALPLRTSPKDVAQSLTLAILKS